MYNKMSFGITLLVFSALVFLFYWYEIRVIQVRKDCAKLVISAKEVQISDAEILYNLCILKKGFKE